MNWAAEIGFSYVHWSHQVYLERAGLGPVVLNLFIARGLIFNGQTISRTRVTDFPISWTTKNVESVVSAMMMMDDNMMIDDVLEG